MFIQFSDAREQRTVSVAACSLSSIKICWLPVFIAANMITKQTNFKLYTIFSPHYKEHPSIQFLFFAVRVVESIPWITHKHWIYFHNRKLLNNRKTQTQFSVGFFSLLLSLCAISVVDTIQKTKPKGLEKFLLLFFFSKRIVL